MTKTEKDKPEANTDIDEDEVLPLDVLLENMLIYRDQMQKHLKAFMLLAKDARMVKEALRLAELVQKCAILSGGLQKMRPPIAIVN